MTQRQQRIADLIHQQLAKLLKKEVCDPRLSKISLTAAYLSLDLKQAKIFYSLLDKKNEKEVQKALSKAIGYLRCLLAKTITLRYVPKLEFIYDRSIERADRISLLIQCSLKDNNKDN